MIPSFCEFLLLFLFPAVLGTIALYSKIVHFSTGPERLSTDSPIREFISSFCILFFLFFNAKKPSGKFVS